MIEGQRPAPVAGVGDDGPPGVVGAPGPSLGPGQEDRRDGVAARVPGRVRVGAELADELDVERGLLAGLAHGGGLERLAVIDEAAGQRPAGRRVPALDEHDAPPPPAFPDLYDDVDGGEGVAELAAGHGVGFRGHCRGLPGALSTNENREINGSSPISGRIPLFGLAHGIASSSPVPLGTSLHGSPPLRGPPSPATGTFEATPIAAARGNPGIGRRTNSNVPFFRRPGPQMGTVPGRTAGSSG